MALTTRLQFGDNDAKIYSKEYLVVDVRCHYTRHYNHSHPDSDPRCERVELTVVAPGNQDLTLIDWYLSGGSQTGRVVFDMTAAAKADTSAYKELLFKNAYCFALAEHYDIGSQNRRQLRLSIVADTITTNGVDFSNPYS